MLLALLVVELVLLLFLLEGEMVGLEVLEML